MTQEFVLWTQLMQEGAHDGLEEGDHAQKEYKS